MAQYGIRLAHKAIKYIPESELANDVAFFSGEDFGTENVGMDPAVFLRNIGMDRYTDNYHPAYNHTVNKMLVYVQAKDFLVLTTPQDKEITWTPRFMFVVDVKTGDFFIINDATPVSGATSVYDGTFDGFSRTGIISYDVINSEPFVCNSEGVHYNITGATASFYDTNDMFAVYNVMSQKTNWIDKFEKEGKTHFPPDEYRKVTMFKQPSGINLYTLIFFEHDGDVDLMVDNGRMKKVNYASIKAQAVTKGDDLVDHYVFASYIDRSIEIDRIVGDIFFISDCAEHLSLNRFDTNVSSDVRCDGDIMFVTNSENKKNILVLRDKSYLFDEWVDDILVTQDQTPAVKKTFVVREGNFVYPLEYNPGVGITVNTKDKMEYDDILVTMRYKYHMAYSIIVIKDGKPYYAFRGKFVPVIDALTKLNKGSGVMGHVAIIGDDMSFYVAPITQSGRFVKRKSF